jgi:cytochrome P450
MDERVAKYVLATGFDNFEKGTRSHEMRYVPLCLPVLRLHCSSVIRETFLGGGIFNRDGDIWKAHRALARPFFAKERIKDFDTFERYTSQTIGVIDNHQRQGQSRNKDGNEDLQAFDAQDLFARLTVDVAATFVSGRLPESIFYSIFF